MTTADVTTESAVLAHLESLGVIDGMVAGPERIGMEVRTRQALRDHPEVWERVWSILPTDLGYRVATYNTTYRRLSLGDLRITAKEEGPK